MREFSCKVENDVARRRIGNAMTEKKRRGFSAMDENKKREIARKGGIAAHRKGTAHKFTSEEAREAGRKGGRSAHRQSQQAPQAPQSNNPAMSPPLPNGNASPDQPAEQTTSQAPAMMPATMPSI